MKCSISTGRLANVLLEFDGEAGAVYGEQNFGFYNGVVVNF